MHISKIMCVIILLSGQSLWGSSSATQTVTFSIDPITEIAFSNDPQPFVACAACAGMQPNDVTDIATFYAITSNGTSENLSASLSTEMPFGTTLYIAAEAPDGAVSLGSVLLNCSSQNLVTGISQVAQTNLQVCYLFQSSVSAGILPATLRVVTFTLSP